MNYSYFEKLLNDLLLAEQAVAKSKTMRDYSDNIDKRNNLRMKLCDYVYAHTTKEQAEPKSTEMNFMDIHSNYDLGLVD